MENLKKLGGGRLFSTMFVSVIFLSVCLIGGLMVGQAQAADVLSLIVEGPNQASDENREYLIDRDFDEPGSPGFGIQGQLDVGDSVRGIIGITTLNSSNANVGGLTANNELTGVFQIKLLSKDDLGQGQVTFIFGPDPDFEADLSGGIGANIGFAPGPGAIVVLFEDESNNFATDFNSLSPATPPAGSDDGTPGRTVPPSSADVSSGLYATEEAFVVLARDGAHFTTLGFAGAPGEGWVVSNVFPVGDNILGSFSFTSGTGLQVFNAGLTRLFNNNPGIFDGVPVAAVTPSPFGGTVEFALSGQVRGVFDLDTPFEASSNLNISFNVEEEEVPANCRVTAGGNKDGVFCPVLANGNPDPEFCEVDDMTNDITHTWGGQAGAPPRVDGNWTHKYLDKLARPHNQFTFHSNDLFFIQCSDFGEFCQPARFAPARQIDFSGIGRFTNKRGVFRDAPDGDLCFMVHLEDIGEPGPGGRWPNATVPCTHCPGTAIVDPDCVNCTDYYEIKIYSEPTGDPVTGQCDGIVLWQNGTASSNCTGGETFVAPFAPYEGYFTRAGNVQIHPDNNGP